MTELVQGALASEASQADVIFDASAKAGALEANLLKLEAKARDKGIAVGVASGLPSFELERIGRFAQSLEGRGIALVPLSAATGKNGTRPLVKREP